MALTYAQKFSFAETVAEILKQNKAAFVSAGLDADKKIAPLLDFRRSGGTFVPRHILWNPKRAISHHSWGIAIDINVKDNPFGKKPKQDRRIVGIFERHGFEWGGRWRTPDGMHFELKEA